MMLFDMTLYILVGLIFMGISVPMIQGRVKPNHFYGFRTPKTLSDERIWYAANAYSGLTLFAAGLVIAGLAPALFLAASLMRLSRETYDLCCLIVLILATLSSVVASFRYLNKL